VRATFGRSASTIAARMQSDDGAETAADLIERSMGWNKN
jgi:hypothetical protein